MKKVTPILLTVISSIAVFNSYAQNLVPNYSFEIYDTCPFHSNQIYFATPWEGVTTNSTDYYNACSSAIGVPANGGFQYARTGVAYAGIWVINSYGGDYREYLQVKLDSILKQDSCYLVEFYCNLHNASGYCVNKMGVYLSNSAVSNVGPLPNGTVLQYSPQILSHRFLNDTLNWMRVGGYYKATGGERYITIGNFSVDNATDTSHIGGSYPDGSYYLIDDVTVKKIAGCDSTVSILEPNNEILFKLYPTPNDGNMVLEFRINSYDVSTIKLYDVTGKIICTYGLNASNNKLHINNTNLNNGIYFYNIEVNNKTVKRDKLIIIK